MIRAADLWMIGLAAAPTRKAARKKTRRGLEFVPTSGAAAPMRDMGELFPSWRLEDAQREAAEREASGNLSDKDPDDKDRGNG
jgi:hypothetical protein